MSDRDAVVSLDRVESLILSMRGRRVILDSDLARLYGVTTKRLNEQVRRNFGRFPADFMFRLTVEEAEALRSQNATSKAGRGGRRYAPYAFTEHGAIMLASVLNTTRAVDVSVYVVRAFVRLREMMATNREVAMKLQELDRKVAGHDEAIRSLVQAIRRLMAPPRPQRRSIGFRVEEAGPRYRLRRPPQRGRRRTG
jgi:ATP-dependent Clp protease ATP-binding subunit ClpA